MNKNLKKLLRDYDHEMAYKKAPDALKDRLDLVTKDKFRDHPVFWHTFGYVTTAIICVSVAFPVGYMLADKGIIGTPQVTCDLIATGEAYLLAHFDQSLRTPVLTFFSADRYQISLYFAIDDGKNQCFYILDSEHDGDLHFTNAELPLDVTSTYMFGSFALDTDESVSFTMDLFEAWTVIDSWDVVFDIPSYMAYI